MSTPADREAVDRLLAAAGLDPSEAERDVLAARHAALRPAIDALYDVDEARDEDPAIAFRARPPGPVG
ncbi:MAG TPA: hypothetical protein VHB30_11800 [Solirubrobacteraceae bacterium]|nr:hypothetical protein [Solirubrobacteraceae bacterium]